MIKANRRDSRIKEAILATGCPPTFEETIKAFERCGVEVDIEEYQRLQLTFANRYKGIEEFDGDLFYLK